MRKLFHWSFFVVGLSCLTNLTFAEEDNQPEKDPAAPEVHTVEKKSEDGEKKERPQPPAEHRAHGERPGKSDPEEVKKRVNSVFDRLDTNKDGNISREEFAAGAEKMHEHLQHPRPPHGPGPHPTFAGPGKHKHGKPGGPEHHARKSHRQEIHIHHHHHFDGPGASFARFGRHHAHGYQGRHAFRHGPGARSFHGGYGYGGHAFFRERQHAERDHGSHERGNFGPRGDRGFHAEGPREHGAWRPERHADADRGHRPGPPPGPRDGDRPEGDRPEGRAQHPRPPRPEAERDHGPDRPQPAHPDRGSRRGPPPRDQEKRKPQPKQEKPAEDNDTNVSTEE